MPPIRKRIALYTPRYLDQTATFIYRQIASAAPEYELHMCTSIARNVAQFPVERLYVNHDAPLSRLSCKVHDRIYGLSRPLRRTEINYWTNLFKEKQIALIHAHFGYAGIQMLPIAKRLKLPLVVTFHGIDASSYLQRKGYRQALQELFEYAQVIAVAEDMRQRLLHVSAGALHTQVIHYGIPIENFPYQARTAIREKVQQGERLSLLQVSRLTAKKGHIYTLEAFKHLLSHHANSELILAGSGELETELKALATSLGIAENVRFLGHVGKEKIAPLMASADIYVQHSITPDSGDMEGFPNALLEAMSCGLAVVSTYHAGIPEMITDGINGLLVAERDIEAYCQKLTELLADDGTLGRAASETVQNRFNQRLQAQKLHAIYDGMAVTRPETL